MHNTHSNFILIQFFFKNFLLPSILCSFGFLCTNIFNMKNTRSLENIFKILKIAEIVF